MEAFQKIGRKGNNRDKEGQRKLYKTKEIIETMEREDILKELGIKEPQKEDIESILENENVDYLIGGKKNLEKKVITGHYRRDSHICSFNKYFLLLNKFTRKRVS